MFYKKKIRMKSLLNYKKNFFYYFIIIYLTIGFYLCLNVGITHDEFHELTGWGVNKNIYLNFLLDKNYDTNFQGVAMGFYGIGFHIISLPIEILFNFFLELNATDYGKDLLIKHPTVFIFFVISGIYLRKLIFLITGNKNYSNICTIFYLTYPYLLGHSFFNVKDIPFMSVWLVCTFYLIKILLFYSHSKKIRLKDFLIISILTSYLLSIRISGVLIFLEYFIFFMVFFQTYNLNILYFIKSTYKFLISFILILIPLFYLFHPNYWKNPMLVIESINYMSHHIQTVCTITLGECMKAQNLPSSYIPIWLFFKLPVLILVGLLCFPFIEKKLFTTKKNRFVIGSTLISIFIIIFSLIFLKVNLYDELRQILFLIPLIFLISLIGIYFYSNRLATKFLFIFIIFFIFQNFKIYPYNYVWLNNLTHITKVNNVFELDYWGVSSKKVANYLEKNKLLNNCTISNRNIAIKAFIKNNDKCFLSFRDLHSKNKRPFNVVLMERATKKGVPNNCKNIHNEEINLNFSNENLILARIFKCS